MRAGVWLFPDQPAPHLVEVVRHAEAVGLDELWLGDEGPAREPFTVLAAAAMVTERIRLAVGITNPYVRHPGLAASSMLTVHELSGGRAILGVGAGGQMSLGPFGLTADRPRSRVEDFLRVARAVCRREATEGYVPNDVALDEVIVGTPLPLYVGARGERLNRLASSLADGAFVSGLPPFRYDEVIGWARADRPIDITVCPSVAFDDEAIERHRPEMIWSLVDSPPEVRAELDLGLDAVRAAADALRAGDPGPARAVVTDEVLHRVMLVGSPREVGRRLAELVRRHRPASVGVAVLQDDLVGGVDDAAAALAAMRDDLAQAEGDGVASPSMDAGADR